MPVIDPVLVLAAQPRHRLHPLPRVPHLDLVGADPGFHPFADQPCRHRIAVVLHANQTTPSYLDAQPLQRFQASPGQGTQVLAFFVQALLPAGIAPRHHGGYEGPVLLPAGKIPAAPQQQFLVQGRLEAPMALFAIAVLMAAGRVGRLGGHTVVRQQGPVAVGELFGVPVPIDCQAHPVGAVPRRHTPQLPQGILQARAQTGETLGEGHTDVLPVRVRQHKMVKQVIEGLAGDGHAQAVHAGEVGRGQPPGFMHLGEEHFPGRPVLGLPGADPPLQRPPHRVGILPRILALQPAEQTPGLQARFPLQQFLQPRPDRRQRIGSGPIAARRPALAGQRAGRAILAGSFAIHVGHHRRFPQRCLLR